ncbi:MAG: DEAD/DEAH box helicase [Hydrogenophilus sp.]|nr:DEAD/DEAH box helicase [Hydrogenophilus sp.]
MRFDQLGLISPLLQALEALQFTEPTPIQARAIPLLLAGRDLLGAAQTGTGKTASFALPVLQRLAPYANTSTSPARHPTRALVLAPTRELVLQVSETFTQLGQYLPLRTIALFGGVDINPQIDLLRRGVEIIVATPGRLLDHLQQKTVRLQQVEFLVFDEADRMLDMGFLPDIRRIIAELPNERQTALFSATFSPEIKKLALEWLRDPVTVEVAPQNTISDTIEHRVIWVEQERKRDALLALLADHPGQALVFVDTKVACGRLTAHLQRHKINAQALHGDKTQQQRLETLHAFRRGQIRVLVATDVAARGLDIEHLPFVVNFSLPHNPEDYIHRIGRTGRAGQKGIAVSLVDRSEEERLAAIEKLLGQRIRAERFLPPPKPSLSRPSRDTEERSPPSPPERQSVSPVLEELPASWRQRGRKSPSSLPDWWSDLPPMRRTTLVPVLLGGTGRRTPSNS